MSAAGGISAQFGMVDEVTYNTPPTVSRFLEFNNETVEGAIDRVESSGLRPGRRVQRSTQWVPGRQNVTGDTEFEWQQQGMGLLLKHMGFAITTSQPSAGPDPTVYEHKGRVGATDGVSFTCQFGRAGVDGVVRPFTYSGCKIAKWDLSIGVDGYLLFKPTIDGAAESTAIALAAATFASGVASLAWTGGTITLPSGATGNVSKFDLTGDNGQKLDRFFLGASASKKEQLEESLRPYAGSVDVEFGDLSAYNLFRTGTPAQMTAFFQGANISHAFNYALEITMPAVRFDGKTPNISGPSIPTTTLPFVALEDGSATTAVQMVYRTTDATP